VCIDPDVIFEIQDDGVAVLGITSVGRNANFIATHAGSAITGKSGIELDSSGVTDDASFQFLILAAGGDVTNDVTLARSTWEVLISQHQLRLAATDGGLLGT